MVYIIQFGSYWLWFMIGITTWNGMISCQEHWISAWVILKSFYASLGVALQIVLPPTKKMFLKRLWVTINLPSELVQPYFVMSINICVSKNGEVGYFMFFHMFFHGQIFLLGFFYPHEIPPTPASGPCRTGPRWIGTPPGWDRGIHRGSGDALEQPHRRDIHG